MVVEIREMPAVAGDLTAPMGLSRKPRRKHAFGLLLAKDRYDASW